MKQQLTFTDDHGNDVSIVCNKSYNKGDRWLWLLEKSIRELGLSRSIVVDKDGNVLCGDKQARISSELGIKKARIIETEGDELIIVKRVDVEADSAKAYEIALTDNLVASKNLYWDADLVLDDMRKKYSFDPRNWSGYECIVRDLDISELLNDDVATEANRSTSPKRIVINKIPSLFE